MKRKICSVLCAMMVISLVGCGSSNKKAENTVVDSTKVVEDNTKVVEDNTSTVEETEGKTVEEESVPENIKIGQGETVTIKNGTNEIELSIEEVTFENEVYSKSDNMFASYFPDKEEESYVVVKPVIKNVGGDTISDNFFDRGKIVITFGDKFNYPMQQLDLQSSVMSQYWSCAPLKTADVWFVQSVPDEVKTMNYVLTITVDGIVYEY